jgi:hypothetical protein
MAERCGTQAKRCCSQPRNVALWPGYVTLSLRDVTLRRGNVALMQEYVAFSRGDVTLLGDMVPGREMWLSSRKILSQAG